MYRGSGELEVSSKEFFNYLVEMLIKDVHDSTRKKITLADLQKDYRYTKKLVKGKKRVEIDFHVKQLISPYIYELEYITTAGKTIIKYEISNIDEHSCYVQYSEESFPNRMLDKFILSTKQVFKEKSVKKKIGMQLLSIEKQIQIKNQP